MAGIEQRRQDQLRSFRSLCDRVGFRLEPHQKKVASALLGPEQEKLITLPRKNGKSRLVGAFAAWHLLNTPEAQAVVVANSKEQGELVIHGEGGEIREKDSHGNEFSSTRTSRARPWASQRAARA